MRTVYKIIIIFSVLLLIWLYSFIPPVSVRYVPENRLDSSVLSKMLSKYSNNIAITYYCLDTGSTAVFIRFKDGTTFEEKKKIADEAERTMENLVEKCDPKATKGIPSKFQKSLSGDDFFTESEGLSFTKEFGIVRKSHIIVASEIICKKDSNLKKCSFKPLVFAVAPRSIPSALLIRKPTVRTEFEQLTLRDPDASFGACVICTYPYEIVSSLPVHVVTEQEFDMSIPYGSKGVAVRLSKWFPFP